jgi:hypothetical protein
MQNLGLLKVFKIVREIIEGTQAESWRRALFEARRTATPGPPQVSEPQWTPWSKGILLRCSTK